MEKTLLQKMFAKPAYSKIILHIPEALQSSFSEETFSNNLIDPSDFILSFYTIKKELETEVSLVKKALTQNGLFWIAYPKNKLLATDLNRDILHTLMKEYGFDGVSLISLNSTWSAMRFKQL